jgi:type I restriction enzyme R subunit
VTNEAFARIKIDQLLKDTDWRLTDGISVRYEYPLDDGGRADYALFDRQGRALAVLEAKSTSVSLSAGEAQGRRYADLLDVPFIFLSNGEEIWFCDKGQDAHFRRIETVFSQDDLARRKPLAISAAARSTSRSTAGSPAAGGVCIRARASRRYAGRSSTGAARCWSRWRPAPARLARRRHC